LVLDWAKGLEGRIVEEDAGTQGPDQVQEKKKRGKRGGGALLGFAKREKERGCRGKRRGRVPCSCLHAHVTRFKGEGSMEKYEKKRR
jgi:hypothetical protein